MKLFSRIFGSGPPLVILHGMFGMSDNWLSIGRELAHRGGYSIHIPDLRNHGNSPHSTTHQYTDMCQDLIEYVDAHGIDNLHLMGHSMGGKLAMIFSLLYPERVARMVVVDIAPTDYRRSGNTFHRDLIDILLAVDLNAFSGRGGVRKELEYRLKDKRLADFLAKSITRSDDKKALVWKCNLEVLQKFLQHLQIGMEELAIHAPCPVETLFIKGDDSDYYLPRHDRDRLFFFPNSTVVGIANAGHWVHSEQPELFIKTTLEFFGRGKNEKTTID